MVKIEDLEDYKVSELKYVNVSFFHYDLHETNIKIENITEELYNEDQ